MIWSFFVTPFSSPDSRGCDCFLQRWPKGGQLVGTRVKWPVSADHNYPKSLIKLVYGTTRIFTKHDHSSGIADPVKTTGHNIKWDHFDILVSGKTDYHCKVKETLFIQQLQPALNVYCVIFLIKKWPYLDLLQRQYTSLFRYYINQINSNKINSFIYVPNH